MYAIAFCLSFVPVLLIVLAWKQWSGTEPDARVPRWRFFSLTACLVAASCAIPIGLAGSLAWLHVGGNPQSKGSPPGIWMILNRVFFWIVIASALLGILAKGRGRFLGIAAAIAAYIAAMAVIILDVA